MKLFSSLLRVKSIERYSPRSTGRDGFRRVLGLWQLTSIGLGGLIGVGIFVLTGIVAATQAGPAVSLSFVIAGVASAAAALCYAEFAGMIPVAGSAYTYAYAVLGELVAWVIGWDLAARICAGRRRRVDRLVRLFASAARATRRDDPRMGDGSAWRRRGPYRRSSGDAGESRCGGSLILRIEWGARFQYDDGGASRLRR